jgi:hypothetical protein
MMQNESTRREEAPESVVEAEIRSVTSRTEGGINDVRSSVVPVFLIR